MKTEIQKALTNLPVEICDIIYEYSKLPFLNEIQNPFNKYNLKKLPWYKYNDEIINHFVSWRGNLLNQYVLPQDMIRVTILGDQHVVNENKLSGNRCVRYYNDSRIAFSLNRDRLKKLCKENGIEFKDRTPTKTLIKKLMKL